MGDQDQPLSAEVFDPEEARRRYAAAAQTHAQALLTLEEGARVELSAWRTCLHETLFPLVLAIMRRMLEAAIGNKERLTLYAQRDGYQEPLFFWDILKQDPSLSGINPPNAEDTAWLMWTMAEELNRQENPHYFVTFQEYDDPCADQGPIWHNVRLRIHFT